MKKPLIKWWSWIRFLDRIHYYNREEINVHKDHTAAMRSLADPEAMKLFKYKQAHTTLDWRGVHPDIKKFWDRFHKAMIKRNIPIRAFELKRSHERQTQLYRDGRSKAIAGMSAHNYGMAIDIIHSKLAWNCSKKQFDCIIAIGKECARKCNIKITNGGDWDFYDPCHWELTNWKEIAQPKIKILTEREKEIKRRIKINMKKTNR